jgi:hypothetical protein
MNPKIDKTKFGSITIAGEKYENDVFIQLDGKIKKRKKKLSKEIYGTSHIVSLAEIQSIYEPGAVRLIFGTGQSGQANLSPEAIDFLQEHQCRFDLFPTPRAIEEWNSASGAVIGLFHITC